MRFFLPRARHVFERLCSLQPVQAEQLALFLRQRKSGSKPPFSSLAASLRCSEDGAYELSDYVLAILSVVDPQINLETIRHELDCAKKDFSLNIDPAQGTEALRVILPVSNELVRERKRLRIEAGFSNKLENFRSLVELRPVFDLQRTTIETWVIGCVLSLGYETPSEDSKTLVLDLDDEDIAGLTKELETITRKKSELRRKVTEVKLL